MLFAGRPSGSIRETGGRYQIGTFRQFQISRVKKRWNRVLPVGKFSSHFHRWLFFNEADRRFTIKGRKFWKANRPTRAPFNVPVRATREQHSILEPPLREDRSAKHRRTADMFIVSQENAIHNSDALEKSGAFSRLELTQIAQKRAHFEHAIRRRALVSRYVRYIKFEKDLHDLYSARMVSSKQDKVLGFVFTNTGFHRSNIQNGCDFAVVKYRKASFESFTLYSSELWVSSEGM